MPKSYDILSCHEAQPQELHLTEKCFPLYNLPPKMDAAFQGLITNAGLMAAGMSHSYNSYTTYLRPLNQRKSRRHRCMFTYDVTEMTDRVA